MFYARMLLLMSLLFSFSLLAGCSGDESETAAPGPEQQESLGTAVDDAGEMEEADDNKAPDDTVENAERPIAANSLDLSYITDDFTSAAILHPARVLNSDFTNELVKAGLPLEKELKELTEGFGIDPRKVEQIVVLADKEAAAAAPGLLPIPLGQPGGFGPGEVIDDNLQKPLPTLIIRLSEGIDQEEFFANMKGAHLEDSEVDGLKVKTPPSQRIVFYFADEKALIATNPYYLKKMVDTKSAESDLITELRSIDATHDLIVVADLTPLRSILEAFSQGFAASAPPRVAPLAQLPVKTKTLTLTAGISHESLLSLTFVMDSENDDAAVDNAVTEALKQVRQRYEQIRPMLLDQNAPYSEAERKALMQIADEIVAEVSHETNGNRLTVSIPKPGNFDKIHAFLKPAIKDARQAAQRSQQKNQLKQIGLAFHNYHDVYEAFPGAGSDASGVLQGLSWRVHLLPYLDQNTLYQQFNLDEPWDSEHNKALISQMPEVFETPEVTREGQTAFHVVIGENTAFQMDKGLRIRDFTDGVSNTILVIQAGPDDADVWTKPGGLEFDEEDPLAAFGNVGEVFHALLADGSVRSISKMIAPETLKALLTRNGREPVGDF